MQTRQIFPFHFLLLPLFFVLHGFNENYPYVSMNVASILFLNYVLFATVIFFVFFFFFKNAVKAGIYLFILLSINFFFGSVQDGLKSVPALRYISRYHVLLSLIVIVSVSSFLYLLKTSRNFRKVNRYLNILMLLFLLLEIFFIIKNTSERKEDNNAANNFRDQQRTYRPDIYFILLDSYAGKESLKELYKYDNSAMENFLRSSGFYVCENSHSNYDLTPFSLASTLNMRYLDWIRNNQIGGAEGYARSVEEIKDNTVAAYLSSQGYEIVNYSIFDLINQPSLVNERYLPVKGRLIADQTLFDRVRKDLFHFFYVGKYAIKWLQGDPYQILHNNEKLIHLTEKATSETSAKPRFVYTHLFMPHPPFYFDEKGHLKDPKTIEADGVSPSLQPYIDNLNVTNAIVKKMIRTIQANTRNNAVIVFAGDHGARLPGHIGDTSLFLNNLSAVYIPGQRYTLYYPSLTNVNIFPVLFNSIFEEDFKVLKDSTFYLRSDE